MHVVKMLALFFLLSTLLVEAKKEMKLTPYLKSSVNVGDRKKVNKLKEKAQKSKKTKKLKYYLEAAQLGDYESQVKMGFYYGFNTLNPEYVDFDESKMTTDYSNYGIDEAVARYYLNAALKNEDVDYYNEQAILGLAYLSLDSIDNPVVARKVCEDLIFAGLVMEEYRLKNPKIYLWPFERYKMRLNMGKLLSTIFFKGIGIERDLLSAHYYSLWVKNEINMPNVKGGNKYSAKIMDYINLMRYGEEGKKYGVGLVSALLLKKAADIYVKKKDNPEVIFWVERSLEADSTNSKAYYLAGCLYLNGDAGLEKNRASAKKWYKKSAALGSHESVAALASIERVELAEEERERAMELAKQAEAERKR